jgi:putative ABC transport system permease protein
MMLIRLAWRNIFRRRIRTLLVVSSISLGTGLLLFVVYYGEGFKIDLYQRYTGIWTGHVQVHATGFSREAGEFSPIPNEALSELPLLLKDSKPEQGKRGITAFTTRLFADGILSIGTRRSPVQLTGVDLNGEETVVQWWKGLESGSLDISERKVLIGHKLAFDTEIAVGDRVVVSTTRSDDSGFSSMSFRVAGTLRTGVAAIDRMGLILSQENFRNLTGYSGGAHEWVLKTDLLDSDFRVDMSRLRLPAFASLNVQPWDELEPGARTIFQMQDTFVWIMIAAILGVVSFGVLNAVTMSFLERIPEIGVQKALGTRDPEILLMILFEGLIISALGICGAAVLAATVYTVTRLTGIPLGAEAEFQGLVLREPVVPVFVMPMTIWIALASLLFVLGAALIVGRRAARLNPIEALTQSRRQA